MGRLVEFGLLDGESVLVEVADLSTAPTVRAMSSSAVAQRAQVTFEEAVGRIQPAVQGMIGQLHALSEQPDEIQIVFGLDLHAEAGAFVAQASADANFSVTLTWRGTGPASGPASRPFPSGSEKVHGQRPRD